MKLSTQDYINQCIYYTNEYLNGVKSGHIVTGNYIKRVVERYQKYLYNPNFIFRNEKVEKIFGFFSFLNVELKNEYVQFPLLPWQCFVLSFIFGFYHKDNEEKRVIKEVLLFIGRKNGKTSFAAALQLYGMLYDNVAVPQSLLLSNTAQQSSVALNYAKNLITHTPQLRERLAGQRSRIVFKDINRQGFCQIFSTIDPARLEGFSPSMAILDEIHNWENNTVYQSIKTGTGARINPLLLIITTAGSKMNGFCQEYLQYHKNILDEKIEDYSSLGIIFQPDNEDDLTNSDCWVKANPSLSFINSMDDLITSYNQAKHSFADKFFFITKHLNLFYDTPNVWIPEEYVTKCFGTFDITKLYGKDAFIGMDLSKNTDLSSIVLYVPVEEEGISYVIPYFWLANMDKNTVRKNGKDLSNWIYDGYITKCKSKTIDLDMIYEKIIELSSNFNIVSLQYDPYNTPVLVSRLKEYGINCVTFKQNASQFNAPMKMLEEMIYKVKIKYANPVLGYHFSNVVLYIDGNANIKIVKNKQNDSVDGVVALAMAVGGWISYKYGDEVMGLNAYLKANL